MKQDISIETLFEKGAHFGHQVRRWNPKMAEYIFGESEGIHVIDLEKTVAAIEEALSLLENTVKEGKKIIFVGTKKQVADKVKEVAHATGQFYVIERWLGGTLTNFDQIKKSLKKMNDMKSEKATGGFSTYTKKERLLLDREIDRLERFFLGLDGLTERPAVLFIIDLKKEIGAVREAKRLGIKTIGICDTNVDPTMVDYPIPMNDDAHEALHYLLDLVVGRLTTKQAPIKKEKETKKEDKPKKKAVKKETKKEETESK